jgi:hypothetical protein
MGRPQAAPFVKREGTSAARVSSTTGHISLERPFAGAPLGIDAVLGRNCRAWRFPTVRANARTAPRDVLQIGAPGL